jgi:hypothetical protein
VRLQGLGELKNPMTSLRIKPVTFWFVAQCLKQLDANNNNNKEERNNNTNQHNFDYQKMSYQKHLLAYAIWRSNALELNTFLRAT